MLIFINFAEQGQYQPLPVEIQIPVIYAGVNGLLDSIPVDQIVRWENEFRAHLTASHGSLLAEISKGSVTEDMEKTIKKVVEDHVETFNA